MKLNKLLFSLIICFVSYQMNAQKLSFEYNIKPIPTNVGIDLLVEVRYQSDSIYTLKMPKDYYGVPNYEQYFKKIKSKNIKLQLDEKGVSQKVLVPDSNGDIHLEYTLSLSQEEMNKFSYSPNVSSSHFHLISSQLILPLGDLNVVHSYSIKIIDYPSDWKFYSSLSGDAEEMFFEANYNHIINSSFGGGSQENLTFLVNGKPVSIFVQGDYEIPNDSIIKAIKKVVKSQREWFNDYDQPFYNITITNRPQHVSGISMPNLFACNIMSEVPKLKLLKLLSHEMFHMWLPNKLRIQLSEKESVLKYSWFYEGFTDYFSKKILLDAGLMTRQEFISSMNTDLYLLANNQSANYTYEQLLQRKKSKKFGSEQNKIAYYKGCLIALKWDYEIKKNSNKSLKDLIVELLNHAGENNNKIDFDTFLRIGDTYGIDIKTDFEKFIIQGLTVEVYPDSFGDNYKYEMSTMNKFYFGFSVDEKRQIFNVKNSSEAYKAGLRNGMTYVNSFNIYLYSNAWMQGSPVRVIVKDKDEEKEFRYMPIGEQMTLYQFHKK